MSRMKGILQNNEAETYGASYRFYLNMMAKIVEKWQADLTVAKFVDSEPWHSTPVIKSLKI